LGSDGLRGGSSWFGRANKSAHETSAGCRELRKARLGAETVAAALAGGQVLRIIDTRHFHTRIAKTSVRQELAIRVFLEGAGDAARPQLHALAQFGGQLALDGQLMPSMAVNQAHVLHFALKLGGRRRAASTPSWELLPVTSHAKTTSIYPKRRRTGLFEDVCADCGAVITGATPDDVLGASCGCQQRREVHYLAELSCMSCGRSIGTVTVEQPNAKLMIPRGMRCQVCGGPPVVTDVLKVLTYPDLPRVKHRVGRLPGRAGLS
jgi:hypothetical protein